MKRTLLLTAAMIFAGHMALAQSVTDQVVAQLQTDGFTRIEVKTGPTQVKVEAIRGTQSVEMVYDLATGALLKSETGTASARDADAPAGVFTNTTDHDFIGKDGKDDQSGEDGSDDDGSDDGDDHDDDHGDDDDGEDDHGDDDHDDDHGDHDSGDDHGGDDD